MRRANPENRERLEYTKGDCYVGLPHIIVDDKYYYLITGDFYIKDARTIVFRNDMFIKNIKENSNEIASK